jgi:predicted ArsR family transcriptional regulator
MTEAPQHRSRQTILVELRRRGPRTIDELVEASGLSKTATRAHVLRMERDGVVERVSGERESRGRPPATFALTEDGASVFPSEDGLLLSRLVRYLEENGAGELVADFFERLWSERMRHLLDTLDTSDLGSTDLDARLHALEATLASTHFMPLIDRSPRADGSQIVNVRECNCPLPAAARASRIPCQLEIDFLARVIGAPPRSISIASSRKDACSFEFAVSPIAGQDAI